MLKQSELHLGERRIVKSQDFETIELHLGERRIANSQDVETK
jgi:hypothetical protein